MTATTLGLVIGARSISPGGIDILASLAGAGVGAGFHVANHIRDRELGGRDSDTIGLAVIAALLLIGAAWKGAPDRA